MYSNVDGIGGLNGITEHHHALDHRYGTMADFGRWMAEAKKRIIRVMG